MARESASSLHDLKDENDYAHTGGKSQMESIKVRLAGGPIPSRSELRQPAILVAIK